LGSKKSPTEKVQHFALQILKRSFFRKNILTMGNPSAKPPLSKRRRDPDEPRPKKKKIRISKRQPQYHSSSEDEGSDNASSANAIPLKPRVASKRSIETTVARAEDIAEEAVENVTKPSALPAKPKSTLKAAPAKPILKHTLPIKTKKPAPVSDHEEDEEEDDSDDEVHDLATNTALNAAPLQDESDADEDVGLDEVATGESSMDEDENDEPDLDSDLESETSMSSSKAAADKKKRNDPNAFATSMSKILDTKLSSSKRADPVLSRSKTAADANKSLADSKLESKARAQIKTEKRALLEKGRVKDVLGLDNENIATGAVMEEEKRLKKTAQRGVVKLFNAVRAAQVKAETAMKAAKQEGVVGLGKREERMNEMSKQGFLDLISSGGKPTAAA
jgi:fusion and transport protein UGO1